MTKKKKRKTPKKRTDAHLRNAIIAAMRMAFSRYAPVYEQRKLQNKIEKYDRFKKDGTPFQKPSVYYECDGCNELIDYKGKINIDHIDPVVEIGKTSSDYSFDEYFKRLNCGIENLQVLCECCHDAKTQSEDILRKEIKNKGK